MSVLYELRDRIAVVTIDRPDVRNAVDVKTARALADAFRRFDDDEGALVAVLTGAGGYFCAGADLKAVAVGEMREMSPEADGPMGPTRMHLSKPVIAAIEGHAVAGGLELALWCDLRVVAEDAVLGVFCRRFGVPLIDLGTIRLPRLIGHSRAMDLILTGRPVPAKEAALMGLANRIAPTGKALDAALELANEIASHPQRCMRSDRRSAIEQWGMTETEAMRNEIQLGLETIESGETVTGATRFTQGAGRHGSSTND
ncbi:MAG: crotonase/enoyl-CoA hydratase family protein [Deltaproteobacteria bacterium]|nr:crotonase/enoyl-CoA hydratase family protein [Deltaproteobacteria bacterium]